MGRREREVERVQPQQNHSDWRRKQSKCLHQQVMKNQQRYPSQRRKKVIEERSTSPVAGQLESSRIGVKWDSSSMYSGTSLHSLGMQGLLRAACWRQARVLLPRLDDTESDLQCQLLEVQERRTS